MKKIDAVLYMKRALYIWVTYLVLFLAWNIAKVIPFGLVFSMIGWFTVISVAVSVIAVIVIQIIHGRGWKGAAESIHIIGLLLLIVTFLTIIIVTSPLWQFVIIELNEAHEQKIAK